MLTSRGHNRPQEVKKGAPMVPIPAAGAGTAEHCLLLLCHLPFTSWSRRSGYLVHCLPAFLHLYHMCEELLQSSRTTEGSVG